MSKRKPLAARWSASLLLPMLLATGCCCVETNKEQAEDREAQSQISQCLQQVFDAAEKKDFNRLDSYHLYGPKFTKFTGSSPERLDAAAGRKGEHDGLGAVNGMKMQADGLKIDVFGEVGIATFILDYSFDRGGERIQRRDRTTLVFVKEGGAWKIAHEHLSPIKP